MPRRGAIPAFFMSGVWGQRSEPRRFQRKLLNFWAAHPQPNPVAVIESQSKRVQEGCIPMNGIIYLVGLVVVILAILSFFGLR